MIISKEQKAWDIARQAHKSQSYGIYPYMYHLEAVVEIAASFMTRREENIILAAILHDALEDTDLTYKDIETVFGYTVAEIVYKVTDELGRNRKHRKEKTYPKIRESWQSVFIKVCDRIANVKHSKEHNEGLFKMYKKEHEEFKTALYSPTDPHFVLNAWAMLEESIKD